MMHGINEGFSVCWRWFALPEPQEASRYGVHVGGVRANWYLGIRQVSDGSRGPAYWAEVAP